MRKHISVNVIGCPQLYCLFYVLFYLLSVQHLAESRAKLNRFHIELAVKLLCGIHVARNPFILSFEFEFEVSLVNVIVIAVAACRFCTLRRMQASDVTKCPNVFCRC